jgi:STE24 endopeptidase
MECITLRIISSVRVGSKHHFNRFSNFFKRIRQYPLYSKTEPPALLAKHFEPGVFEKSQNYGKDKAKFALFSGIFKQLLDSFMLQFGFYSWSWGASQSIMTKLGYGQGYEVKKQYLSVKSEKHSFQNHCQ